MNVYLILSSPGYCAQVILPGLISMESSPATPFSITLQDRLLLFGAPYETPYYLEAVHRAEQHGWVGITLSPSETSAFLEDLRFCGWTCASAKPELYEAWRSTRIGPEFFGPVKPIVKRAVSVETAHVQPAGRLRRLTAWIGAQIRRRRPYDRLKDIPF